MLFRTIVFTAAVAFSVFPAGFANAQGIHQPSVRDTSDQVYQAEAQKINALVHTKLEARFDYKKAQMPAKVWLTLEPYFYSVDSVVLDAKGMEIKAVGIVTGKTTAPAKYTYDGNQLFVQLNKTYRKGQQYKVFIDYIAKPNELEKGGSKAIKDNKGLYFINPTGEEAGKPTQIWTQGEPENTSVWCPTIDKPNQKSTQEFFLVVPSKYVTLSNGKLMHQQKNADGTRTDYWKMDEPHAPYLFFMGVGDFAVVKEMYKGKEVSYYVEKEYAPVARKIFGNTIEMMAYFEKITGVSYPWVKYAQMVARDFVSGAMENTTATLHKEDAQQDARELLDGNGWEGTIAHELFHHWFGNLVTTESWSNLTVNESFANYSQTLWFENKYGKDAGDAENYKDMQAYLGSPEEARKDLVRFYYNDREDMFDLVSYNKGGRILNMLRNHLGDEAFFKGLNVYLTQNRFKTGEAHQLRLAFEEVSGMDLNWFFNQWFFGSGHPKLTITYSYHADSQTVSVAVKQHQDKTFVLPVAIDIYHGTQKQRHSVWVNRKEQVFEFKVKAQPDLVNFDGDKVLLCEKTEEGKSLQAYIFQYKTAGNYVDRREAIAFCAQHQDSLAAADLLRTALRDAYHDLRIFTLQSIDYKKAVVKQLAESNIFELAKGDQKPTVKAEALQALTLYDKEIYRDLIKRSVNDSSYSVAGAALLALNEFDKALAYNEAKRLSGQKARQKLSEAISTTFAINGKAEDLMYVLNWYNTMPFGQSKLDNANTIAYYAIQLQETELVKKAVDALVAMREEIPSAYHESLVPYLNSGILKTIATQKTASKNVSPNPEALQEQIDYIMSKIP